MPVHLGLSWWVWPPFAVGARKPRLPRLLGQRRKPGVVVGRHLAIAIVLLLVVTPRAYSGTSLEFQRQGHWVTASAYLTAPSRIVTGIIADVEAYNEFLPHFMRTAPVRTGSHEPLLRMHVDLPWPCRDIHAVFVRVAAAGEGVYHWEYVEGNIDGGSMELSARPYENGTLVSFLLNVELPQWCPDWVLGILAKRVLGHVLRAIQRKVAV